MKYNKFKAFTLAEVMILLLTLSILMAAFAPVFTRRYTNAGIDDVWTYVVGDSNYDAYYNVVGENLKSQAFVGLTPKDKYDVQKFTSDGNSNVLNSKLVTAASKQLQVSNKPQKQFQFRYGNGAGTLVGTLFAGDHNILVGGSYDDVAKKGNTSFGAGSLSSLGNAGYDYPGNTAIGYKALSGLKHTSGNTAVGSQIVSSNEVGYRNTFIGNQVAKTTNVNVEQNVAIGSQALYDTNGDHYNTTLGIKTLYATGSGRYNNVAVGNYSLSKLDSGSGNTAIGYNALSSLEKGYYNTAIGYNAGGSLVGKSYLTNASYITCVGANSCNGGDPDYYKGDTYSDEVVLIGSSPVVISYIDKNDKYKEGAAVLEVHNRTTRNKYSLPSNNFGDESVVVNGNLIVRGSSYFEMPIYRAANGDSSATSNMYVPKGLVAFGIMTDNNNGNARMFAGIDGSRRSGTSKHNCGRRNRCHNHAFDTVRRNCICTAVVGKYNADNCKPRTTRFWSTNQKRYDVPQVIASSFNSESATSPSKSYDWFSKSTNANGTNGSCNDGGTHYVDKSFGCKMELEHWYQYGENPKDGGKWAPGVDYPLAHMIGEDSCCPNLSPDVPSDKRLKNVGEKFTAGLDEIKKLNIYNYTFKNDSNKLPHVGVIAQELKLVFPTAVTKDKNGYYRIRWDEMFYAAINSIKTLNTKIESLASKIAADQNRIAILKKDNAELNAKLDKLVDELTLLESRKNK